MIYENKYIVWTIAEDNKPKQVFLFKTTKENTYEVCGTEWLAKPYMVDTIYFSKKECQDTLNGVEAA